MPVSLSYRASSPVDRDAIAARAAAHRPWVEPIRFWTGDGPLAGATQVRLIVWVSPDDEHHEVDPADDALMSAREIRAIVSALAAGGDWEIAYGDPIGAIVGGRPDEALAAFLARLPAVDEGRADELLKKYLR